MLFLAYFLINLFCGCYAADVYVWLPSENCSVGHAAIQTEKYYISFYPADCLFEDARNTKEAREAALVLYQGYDLKLLNGQRPNIHRIDDANHRFINMRIEDFFRINSLNPTLFTYNATLARANFRSSPPTFQELEEKLEMITVRLPATSYYIGGPHWEGTMFGQRALSCTTFVLGCLCSLSNVHALFYKDMTDSSEREKGCLPNLMVTGSGRVPQDYFSPESLNSCLPRLVSEHVFEDPPLTEEKITQIYEEIIIPIVSEGGKNTLHHAKQDKWCVIS